MENKTIEELIELLKQDHEEAFNELYRRYQKSVYLTALKMTRCDADAKDVTQLVFIQVRKSAGSIENPEYFPFWLNRVTLSKCKDLFRKNTNFSTFSDEDYLQSNQVIENRKDFLGEENLRALSDQEVLYNFIEELPLKQQEVLRMAYFQQMQMNEIAKFLNISEGTVKTRLRRGKEILHRKISLYERAEETKLNFQDNTLLALLSMVGFQHYNPFKHLKSALTSSQAFKLCALSCVCVLGATGIYKLSLHFDQTQEDTLTHPTSFPSAFVNNQNITNAQDAYYTLSQWAFDSNAIQDRTMESVQSMKPVYLSLKEVGGPYYDLLQSIGWCDTFEKVANI